MVLKKTAMTAISDFSWPLYQNEVKCLAFNRKMILDSHANKNVLGNFESPWSPCGLEIRFVVRGAGAVMPRFRF